MCLQPTTAEEAAYASCTSLIGLGFLHKSHTVSQDCDVVLLDCYMNEHSMPQVRPSRCMLKLLPSYTLVRGFCCLCVLSALEATLAIEARQQLLCCREGSASVVYLEAGAKKANARQMR